MRSAHVWYGDKTLAVEKYAGAIIGLMKIL
jgi:hypothetical protein